MKNDDDEKWEILMDYIVFILKRGNVINSGLDLFQIAESDFLMVKEAYSVVSGVENFKKILKKKEEKFNYYIQKDYKTSNGEKSKMY